MNKCVAFVKRPLKLGCSHTRSCMKTSVNQTPAEYCLNLVKKNDYENFLCTLLLPRHIRSSAFAIRAFNTEVALVEDQVRDPQIGLMRIKFWEQAINDIYNDKPPKNPTCLELHRVLQRVKLSKHYFKRLIEARFKKLNTSIFMNTEDLEKYAENTVSSVYYLLLETKNIKDVHTDHFASHLGKAHGIVTLIRSVPHNAQKRCIVLPQNLLMQHNISAESILQGKSKKELQDVIFEISSRANQHLEKALSLKSNISKESNVIFLPSIIIKNYLDKLLKFDFDIFHPKLQQRDNTLPIKLYWKKLFL